MKKVLRSVFLFSFVLVLLFPLAAQETHKPGGIISDPDAALKLLKEGNNRFVKNRLVQKKEYTLDRKEMISGQHPFAVVLCCSDSRVSPEIIFDQHLGDLFVIRVAGNVLSDIELGSIEYAVDHLHAPLVVVVGHESCGAVTAVVDQITSAPEHAHALPKNIDAIAEQLRPALFSALAKKNLNSGDPDKLKNFKKEILEETCDLNIRRMVGTIHADPMIRHGKTKVIGAKYMLDSGKVNWFAPPKGIDHYKKLHKTEYSTAALTPTVCALMNVPAPSICESDPIEPVLKKAQSVFVDHKPVQRALIFCPDAIGDLHREKYAKDFAPLLKETDFLMKGSNVMQSVTPVCFATIFTGASPYIHGIEKYSKPVLKVETLFDVFLKANKKIAIIAVQNCSIEKIFRERNLDYFATQSNEESFEKTKELLKKDIYDLIVSYDGGYDSSMHKTGVHSEASVNAMKKSIERYLALSKLTDTVWSKYNRITLFAPDHGAHDTSNGKGAHGTESPDDMLVDHYYRLRPAK
ncbi:MAG: carbonic anhydrase [Planctomycetia bacterium]|nr:carbonic anhydrase [Planctomycetia bacterium]